MTDPTPAEPRPTTYRHAVEDVLVALDRVEHLLRNAQGIPGEEALPVRLGPPLPSDAPGRTDADAWNLRVLVEELRAQIEEADDRAAHRSTVTVTVRPELDPEATGDVADELAEAIAARLVGTGPGPVGITPGAGDRDLALEQAVKLLAGTTNAALVVDTAAKFAAFLDTGQTSPDWTPSLLAWLRHVMNETAPEFVTITTGTPEPGAAIFDVAVEDLLAFLGGGASA